MREEGLRGLVVEWFLDLHSSNGYKHLNQLVIILFLDDE